MLTFEGLVFVSIIAMPILFVALALCSYIFIRFFEKKPMLSVMAWAIIIIVSLYAIYFLRWYLSDLGWMPYPSADDMTNLTMGLI